MNDKKELQLSVTKRIIAATLGSYCTCLFVQPLDVMKTELQIHAHLDFQSKLRVGSHIVKECGIGGLYSGLRITLWMLVPRNIIYYALYDNFRNYGQEYLKLKKNTSTLSTQDKLALYATSGAVARTIATIAISPYELMRTQMMARSLSDNLTVRQAIRANIESSITKNGNGNGNSNTLFRKFGIFSSLWKGLISTLARDVPFSVIYWSLYEYTKTELKIRNKNRQTNYNQKKKYNYYIGKSNFGVSFMSGVSAGIVATVLTHPFDVIKTQIQATVDHDSDKRKVSSKTRMRMIDVSNDILRRRGVGGFFAGIAPRVTRVPMASAIMVSTYELAKQHL